MKYQFGDKLRYIREKKKKKLKEIAEKAGVSESLMSQIERNRISPAIDTLLRIADVLDLDFEYLFSDFRRKRKVNLVRAGERNEHRIGDVFFQQLSKTPGRGVHEVEAYIMEIAPGGMSKSDEYGHMGKELGVIISGRGTFYIGNDEYVLEEGDSVSFDSDTPHRLVNTEDYSLKAFWVITPPKMFK
ncbi:MAG: cupin domain-containing protein [Spirochaetota bacterium]